MSHSRLMPTTDHAENGRRFKPAWAAHGTLIAVVVWTAFHPVETSPLTAIVLAGAAWLLLPWASQRWPTAGKFVIVLPVLALLIVSTAGGWDIATGIGEIGLLGAIFCIAFLASREPPPEGAFPLFAMGLAALSILAIWQVIYGFEAATLVVDQLPPHMQQAVAAKLARGRAFASLLTPGHFAVLLATALPILLAKGSGQEGRPENPVRLQNPRRHHLHDFRDSENLGITRAMPTVYEITRNRTSGNTSNFSLRSDLPAGLLARWIGIPLCIIGLVLSASPLGIGLALVASLATFVRSRRAWTALALASIGCAVIVTIMIRAPIASIEPVRLRADNWHTALWLWSTSPVAGVGLGSYGQVSQAVPHRVGNRPIHAHNLALEWSAEMGIAGLLLAVIAGIALLRLLRQLWLTRPELAIALAVIPLHNLADFSLYTSGVAIPWALVLGWAIAVAKPPAANPLGTRARTWAMAGAGALVLVVSLSATSAKLIQATTEADTDPRQLFDAAHYGHRLAPWRAEPVSLALSAAVNSDVSPEFSTEDITNSWSIRPSSAMWAAFRCRLALARGQAPTAVMEAWAATHSQPASRNYSDNLTQLLNLLDSRPDHESD